MVLPAVASGAAVANPEAGHRSVPLGRVRASWAYDPAGHDVVLFGGDPGYQSGPDVVFGQTRTWSGATWTRRQTGPRTVWERHDVAAPLTRTIHSPDGGWNLL